MHQWLANRTPIGRDTAGPLRHGPLHQAEASFLVAVDLHRIQFNPLRRGDAAAGALPDAPQRLSHQHSRQLPRRRSQSGDGGHDPFANMPFGPRGPQARPIYRLEGLATANGIAHGNAHDAMGDVAATVELCRIVCDRSSELWQRFVRFSKKATVAEFVDSEDGFLLTEFYANEAHHAAVVCIGRDPDQPNARFCLRLDCGIDRLAAMSEQDLRAELSVKPSPIRRIRVNAAPTLTPLYEAPDLMLGGIAPGTIEDTSRRIKDDQSLRQRLVAAYLSGQTERPQSLLVEEQLYSAFPGPSDEARMAAFHDASCPEALSIALSFDDLRLRAFGLRLIYFGSRSSLPPELRMEIERLLIDRLLDEAAGGLTLSQAIQALDTVSVENRPGMDALLADYRVHLNDRLSRVTQYRFQHLAVS